MSRTNIFPASLISPTTVTPLNLDLTTLVFALFTIVVHVVTFVIREIKWFVVLNVLQVYREKEDVVSIYANVVIKKQMGMRGTAREKKSEAVF